ncbi:MULTISPECIES: SH3 domain-containing protein [unclassified Streptomyces]|uniref:SH3 domain-containing protein n=1 Tax=unclassified Streptomyces TaxID=2593676 RepID=UPI002259643F|nr:MULTISPECIES: SH3 domain-containing protein [unclassified Streptomyces]MCX5050107.1 SH3 domain-containing protein [Streptomyces sp. NBC_00474]MCX5060505.1 SH3 domain-containing protein [Streptomyces sp. NBC_00452]MCX5248038.1 SH3 domain-containing protein [Streptomyces sp. NBC_00201]MCX5293903.1 SH3 domain-containing protein [Streptomyces sp. NBC_00183]
MSVDRAEEAAGTGEAIAAATVKTYQVAPGFRVNVRSGPGTGYTVVRVLPEGSRVPIYCQTPGTNVAGPYGTSNIWDNVSNGEYISDAYVLTGSDGYVASRCG